ncbi:4-hydroxyacetophenone monooxygenase [Paraburkholderia ginsengiterrae]|uniref:4-hydroxyacetophenone monooxygenase n=1 Tax=Paraburkholderia ginsengiterrae TaxID=1462993 RepID=A0A1A9N2U0_9BURK|nr:NAD(P)/FAD-dependent oxidoreductase [Paraburkholderia ginsengiterrae]OAJ55199.1 4-hydroxyacetophenone monooxygenase [Paraburkholderia ginsengiterrae]OAJ58675.1 4-hydroxyacetophenone monooxygenase [Paraburkholderia ginsengiterrae]
MTPASPATPATPRIAIVGSGFAGIGMAIRLQRMGITSFTIYEAAGDIGGTWRDNTYPGATCDVPSHLYSFSFEPNPAWSHAFGGQAEIFAYLKHCARKYDVDRYVRYNARVSAARFDDTRQVWHVELDVNGVHESIEADVVIAASGPLSRPAMPRIAGLERFEGKLFHSARWDHAYPLEGKRVAVIGTGASAVQFVPQIQPRVAHLDLFQRTAPWVMPKPNKPIGSRAHWLFRNLPATQFFVRSAMYWQHESRAIAFVVNPKLMKFPMKFSLSYLERRVKDPALRAKLTPNYRFGCKRVLLSSDYYPALGQPNVDVVTSGIREIVADGIVTEDGAHHRADAIICGTGFQVNDVGAPFDVTGLDGADLGALWLRDGPEAYFGVSVANFPNFFMIAGPNTGLGHNSMIYMIESQVQYIADCLRVLRRRNARTMNLRADVQRDFNARLQAAMQHSVWTSGCHSWYQTRSGKVTALWPGFTFSFRKRTRRVRPHDYRFAP